MSVLSALLYGEIIYNKISLKSVHLLAMGVHAFNPSTWKTEPSGPLCIKCSLGYTMRQVLRNKQKNITFANMEGGLVE